MFWNKVLRLLKEKGLYKDVISSIDRKDVFNSLKNTPYINSLLEYISHSLCTSLSFNYNFRGHCVDEDKFMKYAHDKMIIIHKIPFNRYDELKKYLYDNGIIWCSKEQIYLASIWDKYPKDITLYIDTRGYVSFSSSNWLPNDLYNYYLMDVDEFYFRFEEMKKNIKNNIHNCFRKGFDYTWLL